MRANWLKIVFLQLDRNKELAQAVDLMMAQAKRIYILLIKVNKFFSKRNRKHVFQVYIKF